MNAGKMTHKMNRRQFVLGGVAATLAGLGYFGYKNISNSLEEKDKRIKELEAFLSKKDADLRILNDKLTELQTLNERLSEENKTLNESLGKQSEQNKTLSESLGNIKSLLLEQLLPPRVSLFVYAVRDARDLATAKLSGKNSARVTHKAWISFPGNDEHFANLKSFLDGANKYRASLDLGPMEYSLFLEGYEVSPYRVKRSLELVKQELGPDLMPKEVEIPDVVGLIISGKAKEVREMIEVINAYKYKPILDINPTAEEIVKRRKVEDDFVKILEEAKDAKAGVNALQTMYYLENGSNFYDAQLEKQIGLSKLARKYKLEQSVVVIPSHCPAYPFLAPAFSEYLDEIKNEFPDAQVIINSLDEPLNSTPISYHAINLVKQKFSEE